MEELFIPATGMAMEDAELIEWLRQPGEEVAAGDAVAIIETDKATVDIVAETSGVLGPHLCAEGERVSAGATIGHVLAPGAAAPAAAPAEPSEPSEPTEPAEPTEPTEPAEPAEPTGAAAAAPLPPAAAGAVDDAVVPEVPLVPVLPEVPADPMSRPWDGDRRPHAETPRVRAGNAAAVAPPPAPAPAVPAVAGPVAAAVPTVNPAPAPAAVPAAAAPVARKPQDRDAKAATALVRAVTESWRTVPHFSVAREIDVTGFLAYREYLRARGSEATMTDILLQAAQRAWRSIRPESSPGVGLAVATPRRVINISVPGAGSNDIDALALRRQAAVERARNGKLRPADYTPVEVTVSNLGPSGVDAFTGVIPPGQLALLTIGRVNDRLELHDGVVRVRKVMWVCANLDHRTLDGVHGAELLEAFQAAGLVRLHDPSEGV